MKNENVPAVEFAETTTLPTAEEVDSNEKALVNRRLFLRHSLVAGAAATGHVARARQNFTRRVAASDLSRKRDQRYAAAGEK